MSGSRALERGLDKGFHVLFLFDVYDGQLVGQLEAVAREALDNGGLCGKLGGSAAVDIGGVHICKAVREIVVSHLFDLLDVYIVALFGQAHQAEAQLGNVLTQIILTHFLFLQNYDFQFFERSSFSTSLPFTW